MFEAAFKNIDDTLWKDAGCSSELDYIEQTSWVLFLKYLDDYKADKVMSAKLDVKPQTFSSRPISTLNTWQTFYQYQLK